MLVKGTVIEKALKVLKTLHPKLFPSYFKLFYQKYGIVLTLALLYTLCGMVYMFLKSQGLWFKKSIKGQHVFITGAGSGIGRKMAIMLSQRGAKISVTDINLAGAEETVKLISNKAGHALAIKLDVTNVEDIHNAAETAKAKFGEVDILINNAGIVFGKSITDLTKKNIDSVFTINSVAHLYTAKEFLPSMLKRNKGHIVTISSAGGTVGVANSSDYSASKFAAFGFDESLRTELKKIGSKVTTTCICPYYINTGMFKGAKSKVSFILNISINNHCNIGSITSTFP